MDPFAIYLHESKYIILYMDYGLTMVLLNFDSMLGSLSA